MGVPILTSREIGSSMRLPIPGNLQEAVSYEQPTGERVAFWHVHKTVNVAVLANDTLTRNPNFEYITDSEFLAEEKENRDWDIRPKKKVREAVNSDFQNNEYVFYICENDWLEKPTKGFYIFTTEDLIRHLPVLQDLKKFQSQLYEGRQSFDTRRPQEGSGGGVMHIQPLISMLENANMTNLEDLVNTVFTNGRIETEFDVPRPKGTAE